MNNVDFRVVSRVQTKDAWDGNWETIDYLDPKECSWCMAPTLSRASVEFNFGSIIQQDRSDFDNYDPTDQVDNFLRIQTKYEDEGAPPGDDGWDTHWVGIVRDDATLV